MVKGIRVVRGTCPTFAPGIDQGLLMEARIPRIERMLTRRNAWIALGLLALLTACAAFALRNVRVDYDLSLIHISEPTRPY